MDPSIQCQICGIISKRNLPHYKHYEAVCCLGCKAFFRRYVRGINQTAFKCKGGGKCDLSVGRKACKECRFRKCLEVGMEDSKVLNEDDRKKYTHLKKKTKSENTTQSGPDHLNCPNCENCLHCESYPNCLNCPRVQNGQNSPVQESTSGIQLVKRRISSAGVQLSHDVPSTLVAHLAQRRISTPGLQLAQDVPSTSDDHLAQRRNCKPGHQLAQDVPSTSGTQLAQDRIMNAQHTNYRTTSVPTPLRQTGLQQTQVCPKRSISPDNTKWNPKTPKRISKTPEPNTSRAMQLTTIQDSKPISVQRAVPLLIQEVQNIFYEILAKVNHPPFLIDHFISGHLNSKSWKSSHSQAFLQLIDINIPIMYHFANQNPLFKELNQADQKLLLNW